MKIILELKYISSKLKLFIYAMNGSNIKSNSNATASTVLHAIISLF